MQLTRRIKYAILLHFKLLVGYILKQNPPSHKVKEQKLLKMLLVNNKNHNGKLQHNNQTVDFLSIFHWFLCQIDKSIVNMNN